MEQEQRHGLSMWAVELLESSEMVGLCGFFPHKQSDEIEIGYVIKACSWGKGYASEAAVAAVDAVHAAGILIYATIRPGNLGSIRVAERVGLKADGQVEDERGPLLVFRSHHDIG